MSDSGKPKLSRTTPFPNELIDEAMPRLNDTQWRVLCVVVRQTLGWHDRQTGNRKIRDWLTQSQLKARTGRNVQALAAAIDALVGQGTIVVEDEAGYPLDTPGKRRAYRGQCYYRLADAWLQRVGLPIAGLTGNDFIPATHVAFQPQIRKTEFASVGKPNRTKEKQTEEKELFSEALPLKAQEKCDEGCPAQTQKFIVLFKQTGKASGLQSVSFALSNQDERRLQILLAKHALKDWRPVISSFFASDMNYIRQRHYSLKAFLDTHHILALSNEKRLRHV